MESALFLTQKCRMIKNMHAQHTHKLLTQFTSIVTRCCLNYALNDNTL